MVKSYGTQTVDFAREEDAFVHRPVRGIRRRSSWGAAVLAVVLGVAALSVVATMHNSLAAQQQIIAKMQQQL
ncbi:hypothetical protein PHYPSEUDO_015573, partial [Phytophthora pseudosyringae]